MIQANKINLSKKLFLNIYYLSASIQKLYTEITLFSFTRIINGNIFAMTSFFINFLPSINNQFRNNNIVLLYTLPKA